MFYLLLILTELTVPHTICDTCNTIYYKIFLIIIIIIIVIIIIVIIIIIIIIIIKGGFTHFHRVLFC